MTFLRWIGRALLLLLITVAISAWVVLATMQSTVLNRQEVYKWLVSSGVYSHLVTSVVQLEPTGGESTLLDKATFQQALQQTLPSTFMQQSAETALNASYDWLEGKTSDISFSIPLAEKRQAFINNLSALLQPKLAGLPTCKSTLTISAGDITCIPAGKNALQVAEQMATQSVGGSSDFLTLPVTPQDVARSLNMPAQSSPLAWLPSVATLVPTLAIALPIFTLLCAAGFVLLSAEKLKNIGTVASYVLFNVIFFTVAGGLLWYFGGNLAFGDQTPVVSDIIVPLTRQAAAAIGMWTTIYSGIVCVICAAAWIAIAVLLQRKKQNMVVLPPRQPEQHLPPVETPAPKAHDIK